MREHYQCFITLIKLYLTCICVLLIVGPAEQMYYFSKEDCMDDVQDLSGCGKTTTLPSGLYGPMDYTDHSEDTLYWAYPEDYNELPAEDTIPRTENRDQITSTTPTTTTVTPSPFQQSFIMQVIRSYIMEYYGETSLMGQLLQKLLGVFSANAGESNNIGLDCMDDVQDLSGCEKTTTLPNGLYGPMDYIDNSEDTLYWAYPEDYNELPDEGTIPRTENIDEITSTTPTTTTVTPSPLQQSFIMQVIRSYIMEYYGETSLIAQLLLKLLGVFNANGDESNNIGLELTTETIDQITSTALPTIVTPSPLERSFIIQAIETYVISHYGETSLIGQLLQKLLSIFSTNDGESNNMGLGGQIVSLGKFVVERGLLKLSYTLYSVVALCLEVTKTITFFMRRESTTESTMASTALATENTDEITSTIPTTTTATPSPVQQSFVMQVIDSYVMGHYGETSLIGQLLQNLLGIFSTNVGKSNNIGLGRLVVSIGKFVVRMGLSKLYILYSAIAFSLEVIARIIFFMRRNSCDFCDSY